MKALGISCIGLIAVVVVVALLAALLGFAFLGNNTDKVLTHNLSAPLNGATMAKVDINTASGNLVIDRLTGGEQMLATGTLEYSENQGLPVRSINSSNGQATLAVKAETANQRWLRFPWDACNAATEWRIHLNPAVSSDITAHSGGGNVMLNLAGLIVTRLLADTGGGNMDVVLPEKATNLTVVAKTGAGDVNVEIGSGIQGTSNVSADSGAGNVVILVPSGIAARIRATGALGKITVDSRYSKLDANMYQSSDYDSAANRIAISVNSGAGNVTVNAK